MFARVENKISGLRRSVARLIADRRGVAAVEFAFIAPLLLCMYFVTMEVGQAIETNKKVGRVGSMVADLITQQQTITPTEVEAVIKIGESTLAPYNRSKSTITVTAIEVTTDATPQVKVAWSRKLANGAIVAGPAKGSTTTLPDALKVAGSFLVRVQSELDYKPVITWAASGKKTLGLTSAFDNISMSETYYLRPRMSTAVTCSAC